MSPGTEITVIIPARNEEQTIAGVLRSLAQQDQISNCQVLVIDGGSTDGTAEIAAAFPFVQVIPSERGLARQLNRGAEAAEAPVLWFLHADVTIPNPMTISYILQTLTQANVVGGACQFQIRGHDLFYRLINSLVNLRSKTLRRAYGDQGIFVKKDTFQKTGGFREMPCSDLDMFLRLQEFGEVRIINSIVATSARTWKRHGKIKTTAWHIKEWLQYEWNRKRNRTNNPA